MAQGHTNWQEQPSTKVPATRKLCFSSASAEAALNAAVSAIRHVTGQKDFDPDWTRFFMVVFSSPLIWPWKWPDSKCLGCSGFFLSAQSEMLFTGIYVLSTFIFHD